MTTTAAPLPRSTTHPTAGTARSRLVTTATPATATPDPRIDPVTATAPPAPPAASVKDNRVTYLAWGAAYLLGWGSFAVGTGADPVLSLPPIVPTAVLAVGLVGATAVTTVEVTRASRGLSGAAKTAGAMFGAAWAIAFTALFLLITALAGDIAGLSDTAGHRVQTLMWPAGSGLVVGLLYLMGGALDRDVLQYTLGVWLALVTTAAVFAGTPGMYGVLALGGGGAYLTAAHLEPRRRAAAARHTTHTRTT